MVRVKLYESDTAGRNFEENSISTGNKDGFQFDMDLTSAFSTFSDIYADDAKPVNVETSTDAGTTESVKSNNHHEDKTLEDRIEKDKTLNQAELLQILKGFLESTSIHGCKNARDGGRVSRIFWSLAIIGMTFFLVNSLVSLVVRYFEHPFVTTWSFRREAAVLAPAVTLCIPSRFHKSKVYARSEAYQMLVMDSVRFDAFGNSATSPNTSEILEKYRVWRKELEKIPVTQAMNQIGFSTKETIVYGTVWAQGKIFEVIDIVIRQESTVNTCWTLDYVTRKRDENDENFYVRDEETPVNITDDDNDAELEFKGGTANNTLEDHNGKNIHGNNITSTTSILNGLTGSGEHVITEKVSELQDKQSFQNSTESFLEQSTFAQSKPTDDSLQSRPAEHFYSTLSPTSEQVNDATEAMNGGTSQSGEDSAHTVDSDSSTSGDNAESENSGLLRMSVGDVITMTINLNQHEWLGYHEYGGLSLYLHPQRGGFWAQEPILLRPGTYNSIRFKNINYKFLPLPFESFSKSDRLVSESGAQDVGGAGSLGCVDTKSPDFKNPMRSMDSEFYATEMCMLELATNITVAKCGCAIDSTQSSVYGVEECSVLDYYSCYLETIDNEFSMLEYQLNTADKYGAESVGEIRCPQECEISTVRVSESAGDFPSVINMQRFIDTYSFNENEFRENYLVISIKPDGPMSETVEHVPEITLLDLVGSVGGYMGLCLGASLLSLTELLQAGVSCVWVIVCKILRKVNWWRKDTTR